MKIAAFHFLKNVQTYTQIQNKILLVIFGFNLKQLEKNEDLTYEDRQVFWIYLNI